MKSNWIVIVIVSFLCIKPVYAILANDDCTVHHGINYNANDSLGLGLLVKFQTESYIEFTLQHYPQSASLELYNSRAASGSWWIGIYATELDFDETTYTGGDYQNWQLINGFDVQDVGLYSIDVADWYNANLGKTMTLCLSAMSLPSDISIGPVFNDHEETCTQNYGGPFLMILDEEPTIPEPTTLLLLGMGGLLIRKR